ncbi:MAG TPA: 2,3-dihydroxybenzoate-AMP ligase [Micromonosporaceae bacterium]|nr:2,3-dihydroxybenzoate-AMP ligase [Micromonosporaceae bacterium]HCU50554.1 2,3-dihydroxybenzoate-AMP ligase [Micromonosporaceae bacterium]
MYGKYYAGQTFGEALREWATWYWDRIAVVDGEQRITYRELDARVDRVAGGLRDRGIGVGDRVVVQLPNSAKFVETVFGLFRLGAIPVFALPAHGHSEIAYLMEHAEAKALITNVDELDGSPPPTPRIDPAGLALLQLSGGSTGLPKLIPRAHDDYFYSVRASAEICGLTMDSVYLAVLPMAHNFTLSSPGVLGTLYAGGTVVACPSPDPRTAFALMEQEKVTITALVPPLALLWLESGRRSSTLQVLQVGGAKLSEAVARRVEPTLGCKLQQVFGMAEGLVCYTRLDDPGETVVTTQGRPISPDDKILIVDDEDRPVPLGTVGHLLTRGPYTIRGYWRAEEHNRVAFTPDGFYRTGDLVRGTPQGHLIVEGRAKDQINRGGEKIAAEEVENLLLKHPAVHDVAVIAVPDPFLGEKSCAVVVLRAEVTGKQLRDFVRAAGVAVYKVPDRVDFVDAFPVTGVGKVSRKHLRAALRAERGQ